MSRRAGSKARGNMRHGLISLLTVVIVLSLATAAVLAVSTSHAMAALAKRQANMTAQGYEAERSAQAMLAGVDAELAKAKKAGTQGAAIAKRLEQRMNSLLAEACAKDVSATYTLKDNLLTCTFTTKGGRMLAVQATIDNDATYDVVSWKLTAAPQEEDTGDTLWTGSTTGE